MEKTCANCRNWKQSIIFPEQGTCPHWDKIRPDSNVKTWTYADEHCEKWEEREE